MKRKLILTLLGVMFLVPQVLATGINVYINNGAVTNLAGASLPDSDYHPYQARLEFFHNSLPAPTASSGRLPVDTGTQYTRIGRQNKYQLSSLSGGTLYVRAWLNSPSGNRQGNYYGLASGGVASGTTLPTDRTMSIQTVYRADVPWAPTIGTISEALVRTGDNLELRLTVPVSYNEAGAGGERRQITGRSLEITYPDGSTATKSGASISLSDVPTGAYRFTPIAANWYGSTRGDTVSYTTLGLGAGGGPETITYTFKRPAGDLGLNPISFPFTSVADVTTLRDLIEAINTQVGENVVTAAGWWDTETQNPVGYLITYNSATINDAAFITAGGAAPDPADVALVRDRSYQISVLREATASFTGTRQ